MATYQDIFFSLNNMGILDVFVPFLLIFPLVFAIMQKTKMLGDNKKINLSIALIISLMVIVPHVIGQYPPGMDVVTIINTSLPGVSLTLVGALAFVLLLGMFAKDSLFGNEKGDNSIRGLISIIAIALVVGIFGNSMNWWETSGIFSFLNDASTQALIIFIAIFWLIINAIVSEEPKYTNDETGKAAKKAAEEAKFLYRLGDFTYKKKDK